MADPKKENGYTPIANELLEVILYLPFSATQLKIIFFIIRYTYGFNRDEANMSVGFLAKGTGISKRHITSELNKLLEWNVIEVVQEHTAIRSRVVRVNKDYDEWNMRCLLPEIKKNVFEEYNSIHTDEEQFSTPDEEQFTTPDEGQFTTPDEEQFSTSGEEQFTTPGEVLFTQEKKDIKKTRKKDIKEKYKRKDVEKKEKPKSYYPADEKLNNTIRDFIDYRKKMKAPMTDHAVNLLINKLDKMTFSNHEKVEIINQSILNGWKGIFPLKQQYAGKEGGGIGKAYNNGHGKVLTGTEIMDQCRREAEERGDTFELPDLDGPFK